jgi:hypothetical protein
MRIAVIPERYGQIFSPCASIRLQSFFDEMRRSSEFEICYLLLSELRKYKPDVVIWHRVALPSLEEVEDLASMSRILGAKMIYDIDDNLLDISDHGESTSYGDKVAAVRRSLAVADEVWCSTQRLATRVQANTLAPPLVLQNALDPALWGAKRLRTMHSTDLAPLRMLYMGTRTHDEDFALLASALDQLDQKSPGSFELTLIGVRARDTSAPSWLRTLNLPSHIGASYPAFVHWFKALEGFDLGVAPLISSRFNDCKSCIKALDYAALGLPTLASNVPGYADSLVDGINCFLADNDVEAWASTIRTLAAQRSTLATVAVGASSLIGWEVFEQGINARINRLRKILSMPAQSDDDCTTSQLPPPLKLW